MTSTNSLLYLKLCLLFLFPWFIIGFESSTLIDLEEKQQDFVLETKQIHLTDFPDAFNPSITRWNNSLLMCFRTRDPETGSTNPIGFVWLNENFDPISAPSLLEIQNEHPEGTYMQDPRLIVLDDRLYMVYSNTWMLPGKEVRRVFIVEIHYENNQFIAGKPEAFLHFEGNGLRRIEKNWVPFEYNGNLLLSYTINPHTVFLPLFSTQKCLTIAKSSADFSWDWGDIRGGTPALLVDNEYLSFFHSSKLMSTKHSNGILMTHYFIGAYTFEMHPPFVLTKISPDIIAGKNFYEGLTHNTWKPLRVVFPCGFVFNKQHIWITYGRQDFELWVVKLDKKKFLNHLVPVEEIYPSTN